VSDAPAYLSGQLLVAMPGMPDPRFAETVILICAHNEEGAMGLVLNKASKDIDFQRILSELSITTPSGPLADRPVLIGGPVETGRGFVLHTADYSAGLAMEVPGGFAITTALSVLRDMAYGTGPSKALLMLGYSGWGPGQLEREIRENGWLIADCDAELVFETPLYDKWRAALGRIGIDPRLLSSEGGSA